VTQKTQDKNEAAEERSKDTRRFARQVRSATRRKYTTEEKIHVVLEGFRREVTVNELCRLEGVKPNNFYSWTKEFMEASHKALGNVTPSDVLDGRRKQILQKRNEVQTQVFRRRRLCNQHLREFAQSVLNAYRTRGDLYLLQNLSLLI